MKFTGWLGNGTVVLEDDGFVVVQECLVWVLCFIITYWRVFCELVGLFFLEKEIERKGLRLTAGISRFLAINSLRLGFPVGICGWHLWIRF